MNNVLISFQQPPNAATPSTGPTSSGTSTATEPSSASDPSSPAPFFRRRRRLLPCFRHLRRRCRDSIQLLSLTSRTNSLGKIQLEFLVKIRNNFDCLLHKAKFCHVILIVIFAILALYNFYQIFSSFCSCAIYIHMRI